MKILVLGATGAVGRLAVQQAVARGHQVTAFVRNPGNVPLDGARVARGSVLDKQALLTALAGQDGVVYAVGVKSTGPRPCFCQSTRFLISAMEQRGVTRLVCITGVGTGETKGHGCFLYDHVILPLFTRNRYADKERQEELIRQSRPAQTPEMQKPVKNLRDPDARTPLAAHVEYWDGRLSGTELVRGITT